MRKLILLFLGLGLAEIVRREATKRGIAPADYLTNAASNAITRLKGKRPIALPNLLFD